MTVNIRDKLGYVKDFNIIIYSHLSYSSSRLRRSKTTRKLFSVCYFNVYTSYRYVENIGTTLQITSINFTPNNIIPENAKNYRQHDVTECVHIHA